MTNRLRSDPAYDPQQRLELWHRLCAGEDVEFPDEPYQKELDAQIAEWSKDLDAFFDSLRLS